MPDNLPNLIYRDLAKNASDLSDYDLFRLTDFIKSTKSDFALDLLLISFTSCYNKYLEQIESIETNNENNNKNILKLLSLRCKNLSSILECFEDDNLINFKKELMDIISSLISNNDFIFSQNFFINLSKIEPLHCLKLLRKNKNDLTDELSSLLISLEEEFEEYQHLSFEVEEIINKNISDFKFDFPNFNYLDFI